MKTYVNAILPLTLACLTHTVSASSSQHRLVWDTNPSSQATIGFTPTGSRNHYVKYGLSTNEIQWQTERVNNTQTFAGSRTSQFVTLTDLPAN